mmetsp:Transcript_53083/g.124578  ORF Transcript_53083/g.124578 Transcript_53083/m.124578 type:complete len:223 (-) Transcript_53083:33-701(-)
MSQVHGIEKMQTLKDLGSNRPDVSQHQPLVTGLSHEVAEALVQQLEHEAAVIQVMGKLPQQLDTVALSARITSPYLSQKLCFCMRVLLVTGHAFHHLHSHHLLGSLLQASQDPAEGALAHLLPDDVVASSQLLATRPVKVRSVPIVLPFLRVFAGVGLMLSCGPSGRILPGRAAAPLLRWLFVAWWLLLLLGLHRVGAFQAPTVEGRLLPRTASHRRELRNG